MSKAPFVIQPDLTAVAIAYRNQNLIHEKALPVLPVGKQDFKYQVHTKADGYTVPDTRVGRKGKPNEVEFTQTEQTSSTVDYGLDYPIPQADMANAGDNYDPRKRAIEGIMDLVKLDREKRVADLIFAAGTYPSGNKVQLSGTDQFSDTANSKPIAKIITALETPILRPNIAVIGRAVWATLRQHPDLVKAIFGNNQSAGLISLQQFKELFELNDVVVGDAWINTAKPGQTASYSRVWGKHMAFLHHASSPQVGTATFGFTAQFGQPIGMQNEDANIGLRGGVIVRAGESVKEVISASDLGYFIQDAVA